MNKATILLEISPTPDRCTEIAEFIGQTHFKHAPKSWELSPAIPSNTPMHLQDQFNAEIRERKLANPVFLIVYGE